MNKVNDIRGLYVEILDRCNAFCPYCYNDSKGMGNIYLPKSRYAALVNEARQLGVTSINLSGGEPFLHPELLDFLEINANNNLETVLITNGSLLHTVDLHRLIKTKPMIRISIDSLCRDVFVSHRGVDQLEQTIAGIRMLRHLYDKISIRINIDYDNVQTIEDDLAFWKALGIREVYLSLLVSAGRGRDTKHLAAYSDQKITELIREIVLEKSSEEMRIYFESGVGVSCPYVREKNGYLTISVNSEGEVYPCMSLNKVGFCVGNIFENSLVDIVHGKEFEGFCQMIETRGKFMKECRNCMVNPMCDKGCIASVLMRGRSLYETDGNCELRRQSILAAMTMGRNHVYPSGRL